MRLYHGTSSKRLEDFEKSEWNTGNTWLYLAADPEAAKSYADMRVDEDQDEFDDYDIEPKILAFDLDTLVSSGKLGPDWDDAMSAFKSGQYPEHPDQWDWETSLERLETVAYQGPLKSALVNESKRSLQQLIESSVREVLKELAPEAPEDAPFGQYLFAPHRKDLSDEEKQEINTDEEMRFRDALRNHYEGDPYSLSKFASKLKDMIGKGWYTKILAAPDTTVYRWISDVDTEVAANILKTTVDDLEEAAGWVQKHGPGVMTPGGIVGKNSGLHSWSTKLEEKWILADLHVPWLQPGQTAMILVAKTSGKNFFINPNTISNVERLPRYAYYQNEVISHGPIEFETAWVLSNSSHSEEGMKGKDVLFQLISSVE